MQGEDARGFAGAAFYFGALMACGGMLLGCCGGLLSASAAWAMILAVLADTGAL